MSSSLKKVVPLAALFYSTSIYAQESSGSPGTQRVPNLQGDYVQKDYDNKLRNVPTLGDYNVAQSNYNVAQSDYVET